MQFPNDMMQRHGNLTIVRIQAWQSILVNSSNICTHTQGLEKNEKGYALTV